MHWMHHICIYRQGIRTRHIVLITTDALNRKQHHAQSPLCPQTMAVLLSNDELPNPSSESYLNVYSNGGHKQIRKVRRLYPCSANEAFCVPIRRQPPEHTTDENPCGDPIAASLPLIRVQLLVELN